MSHDFYELRMYHVERGRMHDMTARWENDLARLFAKHGVHPLGSWHAVSGPELPLFVYLMHWPDWATRQAAWDGFYADPDWAEARTRTNQGTELVEGYTLNFLREISPWQSTAAVEEIELRLVSVDIGQSGAARQPITHALSDALATSASTLHGAMEFMTGSELPKVALFLKINHADERINAALEHAPLGRSTTYHLKRVS